MPSGAQTATPPGAPTVTPSGRCLFGGHWVNLGLSEVAASNPTQGALQVLCSELCTGHQDNPGPASRPKISSIDGTPEVEAKEVRRPKTRRANEVLREDSDEELKAV